MRQPDWQKFYPVLQPREFECKCGCGLQIMHSEHMERLYLARMNSGILFLIVSGCRCYEHNRNIGGVYNSEHISGHGTDIRCNDSRTRFLLLKNFLEVGFQRIGLHKTFIHVGTSPNHPLRVSWFY